MNTKLKNLREAFKAAETKGVTLKELLGDQTKFVSCYVCKGLVPIHKTVYIGQGKHRCESCYPGSVSWMKNSTNSPNYNLFKEACINGEDKNNDK